MDAIVDGAMERHGGALATPEERLAAIRAAAAVIAGGRPREAARQVARVADRTNVPYTLITGELLHTLCSSE
jgi:DNA primase